MNAPHHTDELRAGDERDAAPPPPSFARNAFGRLTVLLNVLGTALIIFMAVAVNGDILSREFFNQPIAGVTEFIALSIVAVVFLQMANTLRENRHVTNDMITAWITRKRPHVARSYVWAVLPDRGVSHGDDRPLRHTYLLGELPRRLLHGHDQGG